MEEVWKDISLSLSSLYTHRHRYRHSATVDHHSLNFQDFLNTNSKNNNNNINNNNNNNTQQVILPLNDKGLFSGGAPATALRLGTGAPAKKRALFVEQEETQERTKRLMKNRESADRSRARKQAYTLELEKEVERLKKENAKLKGQLKMLSSEGYAQLPKRHTLHRTLTAPF